MIREGCSGLQPRNGRTLAHLMFDALGSAIVVGSYEHVPFPTEAQLAKRYGVSRSVTREAVKMLTAKGLLRARPRQGTIVEGRATWRLLDPDVLRWLLEARFSMRMFIQLKELCLAIQPEAAALAARYADAGALETIASTLSSIEDTDVEWVNARKAFSEFHVAILMSCKNPFFGQFRGAIVTAIRTSIGFTSRGILSPESASAHITVRDAIIRHDVEVARIEMRKVVLDILGSYEHGSGDVSDLCVRGGLH